MTPLAPDEGLYGQAESVPPAPVIAGPGLLDQLLGVFTDPVALFGRLANTPLWLGAMVVTVVSQLFMVVAWAVKVDLDAMLRPALEQNPKLSPEQVEAILTMQTKIHLPVSILGVLLVVPLSILLLALIDWLIGKWAAQAEPPSFRQAVSAVTVSGLVALPKVLLIGFMCLVKPVGGLSPDKIAPTSLGYFITLAEPHRHALLYSLDVFTIGGLVLTFLAARHTLRLQSKGAAACVAVAAFFLIIVPTLAGR